jgi:hypothetical protein
MVKCSLCFVSSLVLAISLEPRNHRPCNLHIDSGEELW